MLRFTSHDDLSRLQKSDPVYPLIRDAIQSFSHPEYDPEDEGYVVLIEPEDVDSPVWGNHRLQDIPWEAIQLIEGYFKAVFIPNNDFALVVFIPDAPWIQGDLRACIEANL
ncbi:hypothetical protein [Thiocapsa marina]|uniref:Uncharacterized protein n=1 Tax=Thiocapsa marina 5811 TaxID=768671 RepID=F9UHN7_9GAMM|nr:hypothetical protein [Thiocapsa marina]EGV16346.1 hypothetical protein ThimaDRAFT_4440 [Thiocapsa marina 5811]